MFNIERQIIYNMQVVNQKNHKLLFYDFEQIFQITFIMIIMCWLMLSLV